MILSSQNLQYDAFLGTIMIRHSEVMNNEPRIEVTNSKTVDITVPNTAIRC